MMRKRFYILICIGLFVLYSSLIEPHWITERTYELVLPGLGPTELTLVHIADTHTTRFASREREVIDRIERIDPDYVLIAGDLLKGSSSLECGTDFLSRLRARQGIYLVLGNADAVLADALVAGWTPGENPGYTVLVNENIDCGAFTLVGLDDPVTHRENTYDAFDGVPYTKPVFVLSHFHPESLLREFRDRDVDVVFSGHTHGGQIGLAALVGLVPYAYRSKYRAGHYKVDGTHLLVTKGIGTNIFPFRFLCRPDIIVVHLKGH
jgi:predicted MPP superfamily phosphohydrolase